MPEPTLYLFDGWNLLHAGSFASAEELVDRLASFVALRGARGIVVFDGAAPDELRGSLSVRYARPADHLLERLAALHRATERVCLVSSDRDVRMTAGQEVARRASKDFAEELVGLPPERTRPFRSSVEDALDAETREQLERWRRRRA